MRSYNDNMFVLKEIMDSQQSLRINLSNNHINDENVKYIAKSLMNDLYSSNLHIDLTHNNISHIGANALAEALESGDCKN